MLRCPATKCDCHVAVCLFCRLAPSVLSLISKCARGRSTNLLPEWTHFPEPCEHLWAPAHQTISPTKHSCFLGCDVSLDEWSPNASNDRMPLCDTWNHPPGDGASRHIQWTLELRPAWHTNNLGYDQNFSFDSRPMSWVTTRMPVKANTCIRLCGCKQRPEMR
jgi:hypothetical protein